MKKHLDEQDLVLHYYAEAEAGEGGEWVEQHLAECSECRGQLQALQRVLNVVEMPVPERSADFEDRVWQRIEPKVSRKRQWAWWQPRQWAVAGLMAVLLVVAFVAGRYSPRSGENEMARKSEGGAARERVLVIAVGDHLERSKMVLVELVNQDGGGKGPIDISQEQRSAETLLQQNRLYRQTASAAGDSGLVSLLEDLERVLAEVAHSSTEVSAAELGEIRQRIEGQGLIFKMRVIESKLGERTADPAQASEGRQL